MRLIDASELMEHVWRDKLDSRELIAEMVENAPTIEPKEITFDDVLRYCRSRCLSIITNELLYDLTHMSGQNSICESHHVINSKYECCFAEKGLPVVHCGGDKKKCEILDEE